MDQILKMKGVLWVFHKVKFIQFRKSPSETMAFLFLRNWNNLPLGYSNHSHAYVQCLILTKRSAMKSWQADRSLRGFVALFFLLMKWLLLLLLLWLAIKSTCPEATDSKANTGRGFWGRAPPRTASTTWELGRNPESQSTAPDFLSHTWHFNKILRWSIGK